MKRLFLISALLLISNAIYGQLPMILKWEIVNTSDKEFKIKGSGTYVIKNSSNEVTSTGSLNEGTNYLEFPESDDYTMEISNTSDFAIDYNDFFNFPHEITELIQWGDTDLNANLYQMFAGSKIHISASDTPNFKPGTVLNGMFSMSSATGDLSNWDVSNVVSMRVMFLGDEYFTSDLSGWDVSNVTDMYSMFALCSSFTSDLSEWDVSNVITMYYMFSGASLFNSDLSAWDVSNVINMLGMFQHAHSFNSDLSGWDVSRVTNMGGMFYDAISFNSDLSGWDVSKVMVTSQMFYGAAQFNSDLSSWDVSSVIDASSMFREAPLFSSNLSNWNVQNLEHAHNMFQGASSFTSDLSEWDISSIEFELGLQSIFDDSGMTCSDYSRTLIGWAAKDIIHLYKVVGANNIEYGPAAVDARNLLIDEYYWTFYGDVFNENCVLDTENFEFTADIKVINPVKDNILLITDEKIERTEVYDLTGKKVKEFKGINATATDLRKGVYMLKVYTNKGVKSIKIIKD